MLKNNAMKLNENGLTIHQGDSWELAAHLEPQSINSIVTSPPYWGLRDYGHEDQFGLEQSPDEFVAKLVDLFARLRPALRDDGTLWLNLGDSYNPSGKGSPSINTLSLKDKDLVGIPWRVAFALQADGWYLRQDIIWHKPNPMPESVRDRCTKSHEYVFLLSKSPRYYFDHEAIKEEAKTSPAVRDKNAEGYQADYTNGDRFSPGARVFGADGKRNKRDVWTVPVKPFKGAHFAVMPEALVEPCVLAGTPEGGTVLDPFMGSGTTLAVASRLGRRGVGFELNTEYIEIALKQRLSQSHIF